MYTPVRSQRRLRAYPFQCKVLGGECYNASSCSSDLGQGTFSALHGLDIAYHLSRPSSFCARRHLRTKTHVWLYAHIRNALAEFSHPMVALFSSPTCALRTARRYASIVTSDDDDIVATGQGQYWVSTAEYQSWFRQLSLRERIYARLAPAYLEQTLRV